MNDIEKKSEPFGSAIDRRRFLTATMGGLAVTAVAGSPLKHLAYAPGAIKAIAFDAFPIFDPRPAFAIVKEMFPGKGDQVAEAWRAKQFEYSWLRTSGGTYKDFWAVTTDALIFAARKTSVNLTVSDKGRLMEQFLALDVWPDVVSALEAFRQKGLRLIFLSNMTGQMLRSCSANAKVDGYFEQFISTDSARTYKPSPVAYQLGVDALRLKKEEILFAAFAGWDAAGAKWFGYPTFWVNRQDQPAEELGTTPDGVGKGMAELLGFVQR